MAIHFRILIPQRVISYDNSILESYIKQMDLEIISFLEIKAKTPENEYPEIEEFIFEVNAKFCSKPIPYNNLWKLWIRLVSHINEKERPMLVFYDNNCFKRLRCSNHSDITCTEVSFGVLPFSGKYIQYLKLKNDSQNIINFLHDVYKIEIIFIYQYKKYKMVISYNNIRKIFIDFCGNSFKIFLDIVNPPLIFWLDYKKYKYGCYEITHRTLLQAIDPLIIGKSNVIALNLNNFNSITFEDIINLLHFRCNEKPIHYVHIEIEDKQIPEPLNICWESFGCLYLLKAIFERNFIMQEQSSNLCQDLDNIEHFAYKNELCLEKALKSILFALDSGKIINYWQALIKQYEYYVNNQNEINYNHYTIPDNCCLIRRVVLTPTRVLLYPAEIMCLNRILRKFDCEYSLRIYFRDDNITKLSFLATYADEIIFSVIKNHMINGLIIGNRKYEFLAWSNSQIRDHGVWMYAEDKQSKTAQSIRCWMGDFSHIHQVSKYMARMGQCFSQTEVAVSLPLDSKYVRTEDDIERGYDPNSCKPYCFSDGIGKISTKLAHEVKNSLKHDKLCSAFQIRYKGYKGMLVIDPTLIDVDVVFRKSMKKFDTNESTELEIAKTSAPRSLQLNRPFISLLNDLGIQHNIFLKLQENMLKYLTDMLLDEEKAACYLGSKTPGIYPYDDLFHSGISLTTEPFFHSILLALHRYHIEKIKTKANLDIPVNEGRNMLGVLDETGILKYGEVFVQYTTDISRGETTKETTILEGEVLVTKNPCMHPGDVRKFKAIDIQELHHIIDCIVFPQNGFRPHPNEMAGSDLDGDEYSVIWNKELIFSRENYPPAHFPSASIPNLYPIKVSDMIEFLITYIKNDQVGTIANAHLAFADRYSIFEPISKAIANKFSIAVDFAKNGKSQHLDINERPQEFPDFMEKSDKVTYRSKKVLGKLYRICKDFESENEYVSQFYSNIQIDRELEYHGWELYKESANKSLNKYNNLLNFILRNYGIQHEAEAFSAAFTTLHCRFQERKDKAEVEKVVIDCIKKLCKSMRIEFYEEFASSLDANDIQTKMLQKASAWYMVTYDQPEPLFLSFPWIVSKTLANIKLKQKSKILSTLSPFVFNINQLIESIEIKLIPQEYLEDLHKNYSFNCIQSIVEKTISALILWAQDEKILSPSGLVPSGFLYLDKFIKLILYVAEKEGYIVKNRQPLIQSNIDYSCASLCLAFLRFCISFRFYNKGNIREILPFDIYKHNKLAKHAMQTYHQIALSGKFHSLIKERNDADFEIFEMKAIFIDRKLFLETPIKKSVLTKAEDALIAYSGAKSVSLRESQQIKKVIVCACGTEKAIKLLKDLLRSKDLKYFFITGTKCI